jgi:hypothetical protein
MTKITFTSEKHETFSGWYRRVKVGDQEYVVSVKRDKAVRIAFKPRGQNRGWKWWGAVYRVGTNAGRVWEGYVPGSLGCRGLLTDAGVIKTP